MKLQKFRVSWYPIFELTLTLPIMPCSFPCTRSWCVCVSSPLQIPRIMPSSVCQHCSLWWLRGSTFLSGSRCCKSPAGIPGSLLRARPVPSFQQCPQSLLMNSKCMVPICSMSIRPETAPCCREAEDDATGRRRKIQEEIEEQRKLQW